MTVNITTLLNSQIFSGYTGSRGSLREWTKKTANYTADNNDRIIADTSAGQFTVTLPATPTAGYFVQITDGNNFAANNLLVARNGSTISDIVDDIYINIGNATYEFFYNGSTWLITSTTGPIGYSGSRGDFGYTGSIGYAGSIGYTGSTAFNLVGAPPGVPVGNTVVVIDSFSSQEYRTAKYIISVNGGTEFQCAEALVVHNDVDAYVVNYGIVYTGNARIMNFSANISDGYVTLYGQGVSSTNYVVKLQRIYIAV